MFKMYRRVKTHNALMISLILHLCFLIALSLQLAENPDVVEDVLFIALLQDDRLPSPQVRKPVLAAQIQPPTPRAMSTVDRAGQMPKQATQFFELTPAAAAHREVVVSPDAPIKADEVPDFVTHANLMMYADLSLPDTSLGENSQATSPSQSGVRRGLGAAGRGISKLLNRGEDFYKRLAEQRSESYPPEPDIATAPLDVLLGLGIFQTQVLPGQGLIAEVYVPGYPLYALPDFETLTPIHRFLTAQLNIPERQYTQGFPTPTHFRVVENFALRFRGQLLIQRTGRYDFALIADDGVQLWIDGRLVIDHDGIHQATYRSSSIALTAGLHRVEIRYFQGPRFHIALQWFYTPPGQPSQIVPSGIIYRPN